MAVNKFHKFNSVNQFYCLAKLTLKIVNNLREYEFAVKFCIKG
jgi:hypothetical protein